MYSRTSSVIFGALALITSAQAMEQQNQPQQTLAELINQAQEVFLGQANITLPQIRNNPAANALLLRILTEAELENSALPPIVPGQRRVTNGQIIFIKRASGQWVPVMCTNGANYGLTTGWSEIITIALYHQGILRSRPHGVTEADSRIPN